MKYLAFDLEAANGYKLYSVCSFGYVLADENFNIIKKDNIWINPKCKYNLNGTRENVGINLHLDKELLDNSPDFKGVYDKIKSLLTDDDVCVIGHAVESDVNMLNKTCQHYGLPSINYDFYCTQLFFRLFKGEKDVRSLEKIANEINITFTPHTADDDAYASLMTLKYLTATTGKDILQLAQKYNVRVGNNTNFVMTRTVSLDGQLSKKNITKQALLQIINYIADQHVSPTTKTMQGKLFCLSRQIELADKSIWQPIIDTIYYHGGQYTTKPGKCDFYVILNDNAPTGTEVSRMRYVDTVIAEGKPIKKITIKEFFNLF
ncbi:MAG: hypothetical protein IKV38_01010 [Clostridia bacterium]|nr:hypothetical protein [Clostridia bacterium]